MTFSDFWVIIFFEQAQPQSEGSRHTDLRIKLPPALTLRPNVKLVFTKILNVVQLFTKLTVVTVTVHVVLLLLLFNACQPCPATHIRP